MSVKSFCSGIVLSVLLAASPASLGKEFSVVKEEVKVKLEKSVAALGSMQEAIAKEKIPLATQMNSLKADVEKLSKELDRLKRLRDSRDLNLSALEAEVKARQDEMDYAKNLLIEFVTNQNAGSDSSERQIYEEDFMEVLAQADAPAVTMEDTVKNISALLKGVELGFDRLNRLVGGDQFAGSAVMPDGSYEEGNFILFGPATYFASKSGTGAGLTQDSDSGEPALISLGAEFAAMSDTIGSGSGLLAIDPTQGKALAIASNKETFLEHVQKGGDWIYPILAIAFIAFLIAIFKFAELLRIKTIPKTVLVDVLGDLQTGDTQQALHKANALSGASAGLLTAAIKNASHGKELLEQSLEEVLMNLQPKLDRLLSMVWITASTAPLLGLLGTVTGIIRTFKELMMFGSGDPKAIGGGISEALITTEFGLFVAIPALVAYAGLQRYAKAIGDDFESDAMAILNGVARAKIK